MVGENMTETRYIEGRRRYALAEMVGHGGFATVWRAISEKGEEVAIKIIPVHSTADRARALREGQIAEGLKHPNIVETLEVIPGDYEVYLVTEFVRGMPLDAMAQQYTMEEVVDSLAQILEALIYAHGQGIIHRDIKPQNALVDARGTVKLTDFGIAYRAGDTRLTRAGYAVGTLGYMAPEVMSGAEPSELTDIYAVGATAQTLLSRNPEEPPPRLRELIDRATSPNPEHRPRNAREALWLLTSGRAPATKRAATLEERRVLPKKYSEHALRAVNGATAGGLGYLAGGMLGDGAVALGAAAGFGVLGYLLPRLGALGVIVALAVVLLRNNVVGLGFGAVLPALGMVWAGATRGDLARLPLGPVLAIPAMMAGLGAGLPLFFGALMRPVGAALSSAVGAIALILYEVTLGNDSFIPYIGSPFVQVPIKIGPVGLLGWFERLMSEGFPEVPLFIALWAAMAAVVSLGEWFGRPFIGLAVALAGGALGYAVGVSDPGAPLTQAVISLGFAAIIYGLLRYLGFRARR